MAGTRHDEHGARAYPAFRDGAEACAQPDVDPEIFFPLHGSDTYFAHQAQAIAICRRCPLTRPCLLWALGTRQEHGIYGATTPLQRRQLRNRPR